MLPTSKTRPWPLGQAARVLRDGGIVAYPTEAVFGLGCDPANSAAVERLIALKRRDVGKGLILIASKRRQLAPFVAPLSEQLEAQLEATWPGPVTWLLPTRPDVPHWLHGRHPSIAVRVTAHPLAAALCDAFGGAIVSTSANLAGRPPARSPLRVRRIFGAGVDRILHGPLGGLARPTEIRDGRSGRTVRSG